MPLELTRASVADGARGLGERLRATPKVAAPLVAGIAAEPLAASLLGRELASVLGPALGNPDVVRALLAGTIVTSLAGGLALGAVVPSLSRLGPQLCATGASGLDRASAVLVVPLSVAVVGTTALALPVGLPVLEASPGGLPAMPHVVAALWCAGIVGGVVGSSLRGGRRAARVGALLAAAAALAVLLSSGSGTIRAVATGGSAWWQSAGILAGGTLALAAWGALLTVIDDIGAGRASISRLQPRAAVPATFVAAARVLGRRSDLRAALVGGAGIGLVGVVCSWLARAPAPTGMALGSSGAVLAAAPCAVAVGGALREAEHVWILASSRTSIALAWLAAAGLVTLAPAAVACGAALALGGGEPGDAVPALGVAAGVCAAGLAAGALLPWRGGRVLEQAASLGLFAALCGSLSLISALAGPRLSALGVPSAVTATLVLGLALTGALGSLLRNLEPVS